MQQNGIKGAIIDFVVGKTYKVNFDIVVTSGNITNIEVANGYDGSNITTSGNHTTYITAVSTNDRLTITGNPDFIGSIDNVSVKEVGQDWNLGSNWSIGEDKITSNASGLLQQSTSELTYDKTYKTSFEITEYISGGVKLYSGSGSDTPSYQTSLGTHVVYFVANGNTTSLYSNNFIGSISNISVKEVGQDWSSEQGIWTFGDSVANGNGASGSSEELGQNISSGGIVVGDKVKLSFEIKNYVSGSVQPIGITPTLSKSANGIYEYIGEVTSPNIRMRGSSFNGSVTNISVLEITEDTNLPRINYEGFSYQDSLGSELITNGSFESNSNWTTLGGWSIGGGSANCNGGSIMYTNGGIEVSKTYKVTYTIINYVSGNVRSIFNGTTTDANGTTRNANGTYTENVQSTDNASGTFSFGAVAGSFVGSIDNVSVKEYLGQEVVPNSGCGSWLLEPQSTNLIPYSEDFSQWGITRATLGSNITAPNGNVDGRSLIANTVNDDHLISINVAVIDTSTYTYSAFLKKGNKNWARLWNTSVGYADFDLENGVVGTQFAAVGSIESFGDGWYRCSIVYTAVSTSSNSHRIYTLDGDNDKTFSGDGVTINLYIYGASLEKLSYPTSYIPTQGATSTRLQDIATNSGNASLINSEEGVLYAEIASLKGQFDSNRIISLSDSTNGNQIRFYFPSNIEGQIKIRVDVGGSTIYIFNYNITTSETPIKLAFRYSPNGMDFYGNGALVSSSLLFPNFTNNLNSLQFRRGDGLAGADFYGKNKALAVYKTALTDASLRCLTYPPAVATTFDLDFDTIAEQFTFTRGSEATFVNAQGLIQSTNELGAEEITNGDFATDSDWAKNGTVTISGGTANFNNSASGNNVQQPVTLPSGKQYIATYEITSITDGKFSIYVGGVLSGNQNNQVGVYTEVFTSIGVNQVYVRARGTTSGSIDNVSVKEYTTATNTPRLDYSTGSKAFLLEPQSTNLITYSENFSDSSWLRVGSMNTTDNYTTSPSGQNNATRLQWSNATNYIYQSLSHVGSDFTLSIYLKSNTDVSQQVRLFMDNGAQSQDVLVTTEWQRFELRNTATPTQSNRNTGLIKSGGQVGDLDISIWSAQFEDKSYATSYIPTSGASATRNQELCNDATPVINSEEGTLYAEISALADDGTLRQISLSDGTFNNAILLRYLDLSNQIQAVSRISGSFKGICSYTLLNPTENIKIAYKWRNQDFALWVNGVEVATSTDVAEFVPNILSELSFDRGDNTYPFFGNTKGLKVYPKALADVQLEDLTTI